MLAPLASPGGAWRLLGQLGALLPLPGARTAALLDSAPLARTLPRLISFEQLNRNLDDGRLALALMATAAHSHRPVVFHKGGCPPQRHDRLRGIDYVETERLELEHVLASAAIPMLMPAVHVPRPTSATGWYFDGAPTLNTPLKPALWLGAKRLIVIALNPITRGRTPHPERRPDLFSGAAQLLQGTLGDPLATDIRTLAHTNARLAAGQLPSQSGEHGARPVPYIFIAPQHPLAFGELASRIWRDHYRGPRLGRRRDLALLGQLLDAGADPQRGELLSYLFFAPEYAGALIELGQTDAQRWLDGHPHDPWRLEPLPGWTETDQPGAAAAAELRPANRRQPAAARARARATRTGSTSPRASGRG